MASRCSELTSIYTTTLPTGQGAGDAECNMRVVRRRRGRVW